MPITFTEEDFKTGGTNAPLAFSEADFAPSRPGRKKSRMAIEQEVEKAQAQRPPIEEQGRIGQAMGAALPFAESLTPQGWMRALGTVAAEGMNLPARAYSALMPNQTPPFVIDRNAGTLSQGAPVPFDPTPFQQGQPMLQLPTREGLVNERPDIPLTQVVRETAEGFTTPEGVATVPLFSQALGARVAGIPALAGTVPEKALGQAAAGLFLAQTAPAAGEEIQRAIGAEDPRERELAAYRAALNTIFSGLLGKQLRQSQQVPRSGLLPEDFTQHPADWASRGETAPPSMQLPEHAYVRPTYEAPAGGARFPVDPLGRAVDVSQLSPREQIELMRGPKEFVPRETYVSPAQQPPAILPAPIQMRRLAPPPMMEPVLELPTVPMRPPVEPSGGEISFRGPAPGIPNARQQAIYQSQYPKLPEEPAAIVTGPDAPSYRAPRPAPTPEEYARMKAKEAVEKGLTDPSGMYVGDEPLPYAKEAQYPPEGMPTGTLSKLQRQRILAGQKPRLMQQNNPPMGPAKEVIPNEPIQEVQSQGAKGQEVVPPGGGVEPPPTPRLYAGEGLMFDPQFYKDTAKQVGVYGRKLREYFKGASDKDVTSILDFNKGILPDIGPSLKGQEGKLETRAMRKYQKPYSALDEKQKNRVDYEINKEMSNLIHSKPVGTEKVPFFARLMGGKGRIRTPQDEVLATWYGEEHGVAPAIAASFGEQIKGLVGGVFKVDAEGNLNVKRTKGPGQSLAPQDVITELSKDPNAYILTPRQRTILDKIIHPTGKRLTEMLKKYDILEEMEAELGGVYFPRQVVGHPKEQMTKQGGARVSSSVPTRVFKTEAEGISKGYKYEPDLEKRLVSAVHQVYRAIANKRMAEDPALNATSVAGKRSQLIEFYAEELESGKMTMEKIDRIMKGIRAKQEVQQPALMGKLFEPEVAEMLRREFAAETAQLRKIIVSGNASVKAVQLGFDLGVGQIQMLPFLYDHPALWAKAQVMSLRSALQPEVFTKYVRANAAIVNEMAQLGSPIGKLQEHVSGLGSGQPIVDLPKKAGQFVEKFTGIPGSKYAVGAPGYVAEAFGRQFQTALDVAKIETYKAWKEAGIPAGEALKVMRTIEHTLLSARMQSAGITHRRALLEQIAFLAPAYYRGGVELISGLKDKGVSGKIARRSVMRYATGGALTFYLMAKILGLNDEEIEKRMDPRRADFMTWPVEGPDGRRVNLGFGGLYRNWLRLAGSITKTTQEHPEDWKSLSPEKNPLTRWYRAHAAPLPSIGWEAFTGKDFLGRESDVVDLGKRVLPLTIQQGINRPEEPKAQPIEFATSFLGGTATPESFSEFRQRETEQAAQKKYQKPYGMLTFNQRGEIDEVVDKRMEGVKTGLTEARARDIAIKKADERFQALQKNLDPTVKQWMDSKGFKVRNYQLFKTLDGQQIRLAPDEQEVFEKSILTEYNRQLKFVMNHRKPDQDLVDERLERARTRAWKEVRRYIASKRTGGTTPAKPQ